MRQNQKIRAAAIFLLSLTFVWFAFLKDGFSQTDLDGFEFPYQALVLREGASIHSGPGKSHYATENLAQGDAVLVYRHDPGGWCAIRPVDGSFSLVPESTLEIVRAGLGKVTQADTQAWVGTALGAVDNPLWQIKLRKDEIVEVLGQVSWPSPEGHSTVWYQIAPPAGEFRWIRMSDIQLPRIHRQSLSNEVASSNDTMMSYESLTAGPSSDYPSTYTLSKAPNLDAAQPGQTAIQATYEDRGSRSNGQTSANSINGGWRQATRPIQNSSSTTQYSGSLFQSNDRFESSSAQFDEQAFSRREMKEEFSNQPVKAYRGEPVRVANADTGLKGFAGQLNAVRNLGLGKSNSVTVGELDLRLTEEMLKRDPSQWNLDELEAAAKSMTRGFVDPVQRESATQFLVKLANCRALQSGFQSNSMAGRIDRPSTGDSNLNATYDAHGWLNKLVRNGGESESTFVLQDATGKVTHHVTPVPGLNLHRYLKTRIGIVGQRGYHQQLNLSHVTAHQVTSLDNQRR